MNSGLVATGAFVAQLDRELGPGTLHRGHDSERSYVVVGLDDGGERLLVGLRKLGVARPAPHLPQGLETPPASAAAAGAARS